jgi:hypothetical protein
MAEQLGELGTTIISKGIPLFVIGFLIILTLALITFLAIFFYKRKKWNLKGTIYLLRNNINEQFEDNCKGYWDSQNGWIVIKRKGYKKVHSRPFDPKKWLVGRDRFHLVQVGIDDFLIARLEWEKLTDDETGEEVITSKIISDLGKRKVWKNFAERSGKNAFTLSSWAEKHQLAIALSVVIFCMFIGFTILWSRMPSICQV